MIIKYQQFAKTNTFSLSFHILFSPFLHIFPQDTSKSGFGDGQKLAKMGLDPPPRGSHTWIEKERDNLYEQWDRQIRFY